MAAQELNQILDGYDSLRNARSDAHGIFDERYSDDGADFGTYEPHQNSYEPEEEEAIYDEPSGLDEKFLFLSILKF